MRNGFPTDDGFGKADYGRLYGQQCSMKRGLKAVRNMSAIFLILLFPCPIHAELPSRWVKVHQYPGGGVDYVDTETIVKTGDKISYWTLMDYSKDRSVRYRFKKYRQEVDCKILTFKWIFGFIEMPNGQRTLQTLPDTTFPIVPGDDSESELRFVCGRQLES